MMGKGKAVFIAVVHSLLPSCYFIITFLWIQQCIVISAAMTFNCLYLKCQATYEGF